MTHMHVGWLEVHNLNFIYIGKSLFKFSFKLLKSFHGCDFSIKTNINLSENRSINIYITNYYHIAISPLSTWTA